MFSKSQSNKAVSSECGERKKKKKQKNKTKKHGTGGGGGGWQLVLCKLALHRNWTGSWTTGYIIYPALSYEDALKLANISSLAVRRRELCDKYLKKIHMKDHPNSFLVNKTPAGTTHNYSLRPRAAVERNSSACQTLGSSSFITLWH